jgi:hypothetical protein
MLKVYELIIPETVEAIPVTTETEKWIVSWCKGVLIENIHPVTKNRQVLGVYVPTLNGVKEGFYGMYVVRKRSGDFCVMSKQKFEAKFKPIR